MTLLGLLGPLGLPEILVILVLVVLLFGARRIPDLARGLGEGIRGFRSALRGDDEPSNKTKPGGDPPPKD